MQQTTILMEAWRHKKYTNFMILINIQLLVELVISLKNIGAKER